MAALKSRRFWLSARSIFTVIDDAIETVFGGKPKDLFEDRETEVGAYLKQVHDSPEVTMAKNWQMVGDAIREAMERFARENDLPAPSHAVNKTEVNGR